MKFLHITYLILVLQLLSGCEKSQDTTWMFYDETYCSDPWVEVIDPDTELKEDIAKYLQSQGINIFEIEITNEGNQQVCLACHCTTGKLIKCKILDKDVSEMETLGFYK